MSVCLIQLVCVEASFLWRLLFVLRCEISTYLTTQSTTSFYTASIGFVIPVSRGLKTCFLQAMS